MLLGSEIMKRIMLLILSFILLIPITVSASTRAQDLPDTLEEDGISISIEDYQETDDQVVMYLFWGNGCEHCQAELEFLNSILDEYKDKIKLRSYETWYNTSNAELEEKILNFFELTDKGVPFLIIGESTFIGYDEETTGEKIKTAIDELYQLPKEERYDVFVEMDKEQTDTKGSPIVYFFGGIVVAVIIVLVILLKTKK